MSGRKVLRKKNTNVVVDTNTLIRALANFEPYSKALEHLIEKCDTIVFSTQIMKEYFGKFHKAGMTKTFFQRKLEDIRQLGKLRRCYETPLRKARKQIKTKHLPLPNDRTDIKFIETAIASNARYIVTNDGELLRMNPYRYQNSHISIIDPVEYRSIET